MTSAVIQALTDAGVAGVILLVIIYFMLYKFWPWYTQEYWPAKRGKEDKEASALQGIFQTLASLKDMGDVRTSDFDEFKRIQSETNTQLRIITARWVKQGDISFGEKSET